MIMRDKVSKKFCRGRIRKGGKTFLDFVDLASSLPTTSTTTFFPFPPSLPIPPRSPSAGDGFLRPTTTSALLPPHSLPYFLALKINLPLSLSLNLLLLPSASNLTTSFSPSFLPYYLPTLLS